MYRIIDGSGYRGPPFALSGRRAKGVPGDYPLVDDTYGPLSRLSDTPRHTSRPDPCRSCVYPSPSTACTWCRRVPVRHPDGTLRPLEVSHG